MSLANSKILKALTVEVIRFLWNQGLYRDNRLLKMCHDNWFDIWVAWRTTMTMEDVDRQIEDFPHEEEKLRAVYYEQKNGETPLGGAMGIKHEFTDHDA